VNVTSWRWSPHTSEKDLVGVGTNQLYCADNNDEDYSQHDSVFCDVLSFGRRMRSNCRFVTAKST